nr:MAG TPA: YopX protein [Caudoviricetes sp.]
MIPKFRAWLKKDKEMTDVEEIHFYKGEFDFIGDAITWMCKGNDCVLMQSTGLKDKNGKEIFEGDILSIETDEENVKVDVSWDDKHALFVFESKKYNEKECLGELFEDNSYPFKIIGNIYENPELAEVSS